MFNSDPENMSTSMTSLNDREISDLLNDDVNHDEEFEKTENIVTELVSQVIGSEIFTGKLKLQETTCT